ncbi:MAG: MiaB/RimO family radical SAM methylthiotransferase [Patescibacteria group bacterium]
MKIFFQNFGCKLNLAELQELKISAFDLGYTSTNQIRHADLILINTCNVTGRAFEKIQQFIQKNIQTDKIFIVTGCMPLSFIRQKNPDNILVVPSAKKNTVPGLLKKLITKPSQKAIIPISTRPQLAKTRSFIKIQSGCNTRCSYCVIPFQRGNSSSISPDEIIKQINFYLQHDFQEIVLTGTNLGQYKYEKFDLQQLIKFILDQTNIKRLRISSIDVCDINDELLSLYQSYSKIICPHFHLALQSGSDKILKLMRRPYSVSKYLATTKKIYKLIPGVSITTDVIVGFPGEDQQDLDCTIQVIEQIPFLKVHLFSYSNHSQTDSSKYANQVDYQEIKKRYQMLNAVASKSRHLFFTSQIGKIVPVLIEQIRQKDQNKNIYRGYSDSYLPVIINSSQPLSPNRIYPIKIRKIVANDLMGEQE